MASSRTCIVHIGAPKTGSTLIQRVLFENRALMLAAGALYPDVSLRGYGHHDLAFLVAGGYPAWATPQSRSLDELAQELGSQCRAHDGNVLLSSEDFYLCPNPQGLYELLRETGALHRRECRIIVYLRRQDDAHESWYNQTIKAQGATHSLEESIETSYQLWDYRHQLQRWEAVFGRDALCVRSYEGEDLFHGSLLEDFFDCAGIDGAGFSISRQRVNTGLNRDLLEFQRVMNGLPLSIQNKRAFHHQLIDLSASAAGSGLFDETPSMDPDLAERIMDRYAEGNASVAERYFGRPYLFGARTTAIAPRAARQGLDVSKLASIVAWLLVKRDA